jgi:hypothetical protein
MIVSTLILGLAIGNARAQGGVSGLKVTFKGSNFFPIGLYDYPRGGQAIQNQDVNHMSTIVADGFNTLELFDHDCGWPLDELETCTTGDLDTANSVGLAIVDALYSYNYSGPTCWLYQSSQTQVGSAMYNQLLALRSKPALLAWEHMDETGVTWANYGSSTPYYFPTNAQFQTDYNFIKTYGGGIPVWYNDGPAYFQNAYYSTATGQTWANSSDIYSNDIYPASVGAASWAPDYIKQQMDWTVHCEPNKPQMIALNAGDHANDQWDLETRKYMAFSAIIHGARGIFWWGAFNLNYTDAQWSWIVTVAQQLKAIQGALANNSIDAYKYNDTYVSAWKTLGTITMNNAAFEARCFTYNGKHYLIVANTSSNSETNTISAVSNWSGTTLNCMTGWPNLTMGQSATWGAHTAAIYHD